MPSIRDEIRIDHTDNNTFKTGDWPGRGQCKVRALVYHVMDGSLSGSISWAKNPESQASFNYGVGKNGQIVEVVDPDQRAPWANGIVDPADTDLPAHLRDLLTQRVNANWVTVSIELEGKPNDADFPTEPQLRSAIRLGAWICERYQLNPTRDTVLPHRAFSLRERPFCPGPRVDFDRLVRGIQDELGSVVSQSAGLTGDSLWLAPPSAAAERASSYIIGRGSVYTPFDIGVIVGHYWRLGQAVGLDPVLAMAQCILETSAQQPNGQWWPLSSWWAQRPRRNPAGLGVTGEVQTEQPANTAGWVFDEPSGQWRRGLTFATWELAAEAHIGRLLAYALTNEQTNPAQLALIDKALALRPLPAHLRGVAPTPIGLNGRWAVPGTTYGQHIATLANEICGATPISREMPTVDRAIPIEVAPMAGAPTPATRSRRRSAPAAASAPERAASAPAKPAAKSPAAKPAAKSPAAKPAAKSPAAKAPTARKPAAKKAATTDKAPPSPRSRRRTPTT